MNNETTDFFNKNKFVVIKNFITPELALFFYEYCKIKVQQIDFKQLNDPVNYNKDWDGQFGDGQIPNSYNCYADPMMETLLYLSQNRIADFIGLDLHMNYSYWRFYQPENILERHRDRGSCEISTTLCLGYDVSNIDKNVLPDYKWPMFVEGTNGEEIPVSLEPGDLIIYKGCEVDHWREAFLGLNHAQVFLHYNIQKEEKIKDFDGRPLLALPSTFRRPDLK